jgi:hypothetical protein
MSHHFKETVKVGYGNRLISSFKGIAIGLILFLASFGVLYWNEGRVDLGSIAEVSVAIDGLGDTSELEGRLIDTSGVIHSNETLGDNLFLNPGDYLAARRTVEMWAWTEESSTSTKKNLGGSETRETTYNYHREWTKNPAKSSGFRHPVDHENPGLSMESDSFTVSRAQVNDLTIDVSKIELPGFENLTLNELNINLGGEVNDLQGNYVFVLGNEFYGGTFKDPEVGDIRVRYDVVPNDIEGTVLGKLNGNKIEPFIDTDNKDARVYMISQGSKDEAVANLHKTHSMMTWVWRLVGFLMMWIGLKSLLGPISVSLDIVPFLGSLSGSIIGLATMLIALALSIVTIALAMFLHSLLAVVIAAIAVVGGVILYLRSKHK